MVDTGTDLEETIKRSFTTRAAHLAFMGNSTAGKTTLENHLPVQMPSLTPVIRYVDRQPKVRDTFLEVGSPSTHFLSPVQFDKLIAEKGKKLMVYKRGDDRYGRDFSTVEEEIRAGRGCYSSVTVPDIMPDMIARFPNDTFPVFLHVSLEEGERRMIARADSQADIRERIRAWVSEDVFEQHAVARINTDPSTAVRSTYYVGNKQDMVRRAILLARFILNEFPAELDPSELHTFYLNKVMETLHSLRDAECRMTIADGNEPPLAVWLKGPVKQNGVFTYNIDLHCVPEVVTKDRVPEHLATIDRVFKFVERRIKTPPWYSERNAHHYALTDPFSRVPDSGYAVRITSTPAPSLPR